MLSTVSIGSIRVAKAPPIESNRHRIYRILLVGIEVS